MTDWLKAAGAIVGGCALIALAVLLVAGVMRLAFWALP